MDTAMLAFNVGLIVTKATVIGIVTGNGTEAGADREPGQGVIAEGQGRDLLVLISEDRRGAKDLAGSFHRHHNISRLDLQTDHHQSIYLKREGWHLG